MSRPGIGDLLFHDEAAPTVSIETPEAVPVSFRVAAAGDRLWGLTIDLLFLSLLLLVLWIPAWIAGASGSLASGAIALLLLATFLLRHFYFVWFEIRWQGSTPGKRKAGTRVVERSGRPLTPGAIFTRNLTREFEIFLPLVAVFAPQAVEGAGASGVVLIALLWMAVLGLLPLFNRHRLRMGDLLAGTVVVTDPRPVLLADLSAPKRERPGGEGRAGYVFTREQLDIYGIYELQVLENLLRSRGPQRKRAMRTVADKIREKIGWSGSVRPERFLRDFYDAQRARLESRMLLGERRERKRE